MYWSKIEEIDVPVLHDAALLCSMQGMKFRSLYMDPQGELAISFYGRLPIEKIREVLIQFHENPDALYSSVNPEEHVDYIYQNDHQEGYTTQIYTPDGVNYRKLLNIE